VASHSLFLYLLLLIEPLSTTPLTNRPISILKTSQGSWADHEMEIKKAKKKKALSSNHYHLQYKSFCNNHSESFVYIYTVRKNAEIYFLFLFFNLFAKLLCFFSTYLLYSSLLHLCSPAAYSFLLFHRFCTTFHR